MFEILIIVFVIIFVVLIGLTLFFILSNHTLSVKLQSNTNSNSDQIIYDNETLFKNDSNIPTNNTVNVRLGIPEAFTYFWPNQNCIYDLNYVLLDSEIEKLSIRNFVSFMKKFRNYDVDPNKVVIGNGSMQLLNAYMYSVKKVLQFQSTEEYMTTSVKTKIKIFIQSPTFFEIKTIAQIYEIEISEDVNDDIDIEYICVINNPTGNIIYPLTNAKYKIYDYAYWYPGFTLIKKPYSPIGDFTFSFSKIGLSGLRIGFCEIQHEELIPFMRDFLFASTIGVSSSSYSYFIRNFDLVHNYDINYNRIQASQMKQKIIMENRWKHVNKYRNSISIINSQGAYAVSTHNSDFFLRYGIEVLPIELNSQSNNRIIHPNMLYRNNLEDIVQQDIDILNNQYNMGSRISLIGNEIDFIHLISIFDSISSRKF